MSADDLLAYLASHRKAADKVALTYLSLSTEKERLELLAFSARTYWREVNSQRPDLTSDLRVELTIGFTRMIVDRLNQMAPSGGHGMASA